MMDVLNNGKFISSTMGDINPDDSPTVGPANEDVFWNSLQRGVSLIYSLPAKLSVMFTETWRYPGTIVLCA